MKSTAVTYLLWILGGFGVLGLQRFYLGRWVSGLIWLLTGGVFFIGALVDLFVIPEMVRVENLSRKLLEQAGEVEFRRARTGERVSVSNRYFSEPGRPFHDPGATLRDDYVIFALDVKPAEMRVLEPAAQAPRLGARVEVLGIPSDDRDVTTNGLRGR